MTVKVGKKPYFWSQSLGLLRNATQVSQGSCYTAPSSWCEYLTKMSPPPPLSLSLSHTHTHTYARTRVCASFRGCKNPGRLNLSLWRLTIKGHHYGTCFASQFNACNSKVASRFLDNLYTPALIHTTYSRALLELLAVTWLVKEFCAFNGTLKWLYQVRNSPLDK